MRIGNTAVALASVQVYGQLHQTIVEIETQKSNLDGIY
jgi:hypothetical protein